MDTSHAVEMTVERWLSRLEQGGGRIQRCSVGIELPHRHARHGSEFEVRVDLVVPDRELVVTECHEDIYVAIANAFRAARRRLREYTDIRRGDVKLHPSA